MYECYDTCMSLCHVCAWCPQRLEEGVRALGTEVIDDDEMPCGSLEMNLDPLKEQLLLLTVEPSLQTLLVLFVFLLFNSLIGFLITIKWVSIECLNFSCQSQV